MDDTSCSSPARLHKQLRVFGAITVPFAIISFGLAVGLNTYLQNPALGGWYIALLTLLCGVFGVFSRTRGIVITICVCSIIAVILGIVISAVDGFSASAINSIEACSQYVSYNGTYTFNRFGNSLYFTTADGCALDNTDFDCACVNSFSNSTCLLFDGQSNCDLITTDFLQMLRAATAFDVLSLFSVFAVSLSACCSLCCPGNACIRDETEVQMAAATARYAPNGDAPAVVYVGSIQQTAAVPPEVPFHQQPQVQMYAQYNQQHVAQATAVPVYGKA